MNLQNSLNNFILRTDSYKFGGHWKMLRPNTTTIHSYLESRGGRFSKTVQYGLQGILKNYFAGCVVTPAMVEQAREFSLYHLGTVENFNYDGWMYIAVELGGKLPLEIYAAPEGSLISTSNVLVTVKNTDDKCAWLTSYIESLLLKVWYPITIATNGFYLKLLINKFYDLTSDKSFIDFLMHDFAYRSVTSEEQARIGGSAHLFNFTGTDNIQGILYANEYYKAGVCGQSIPASEHTISTAFGRGQGEIEYLIYLLKKFPKGYFSIVMDTYDVLGLIRQTYENEEVRRLILERDGKVVFRPDSGNPTEIISKILNSLWKGFGGVYNSKGYKVIDEKVGIIQGDKIDYQMTEEILEMMEANKFAADNLVFGSGSALLNKGFDRDTQNFAFKASFMIIDGVETNVQKDPITSHGKLSKPGYLKLIPQYDGSFNTLSSTSTDKANFESAVSVLKLVFLNGEVQNEVTFDEAKAVLLTHFNREKRTYTLLNDLKKAA